MRVRCRAGVAKTAEEATGTFKTKLSATGLVYKHFGREILQALCPGLDGTRLEAVYTKLYKDMVECVRSALQLKTVGLCTD